MVFGLQVRMYGDTVEFFLLSSKTQQMSFVTGFSEKGI